jgi:hypothetical protein
VTHDIGGLTELLWPSEDDCQLLAERVLQQQRVKTTEYRGFKEMCVYSIQMLANILVSLANCLLAATRQIALSTLVLRFLKLSLSKVAAQCLETMNH